MVIISKVSDTFSEQLYLVFKVVISPLLIYHICWSWYCYSCSVLWSMSRWISIVVSQIRSFLKLIMEINSLSIFVAVHGVLVFPSNGNQSRVPECGRERFIGLPNNWLEFNSLMHQNFCSRHLVISFFDNNCYFVTCSC